tara:strand:- start:200 stop:943 length:744 start_codon:yes stop_codon:yes gene_type:complete
MMENDVKTKRTAFRQFMEKNKKCNQAFKIIKECLAQEFPNDKDNNMKGKQSFVEMIDHKTNMVDDTQLKASDEIVIESYNPAWPKFARAEINAIKLVCEKLPFESIHHIGSTAVPGLSSKPIIDIFIVIENITNASKWVKQLSAMGYVDWPANPDKTHVRLFKGMPPFGSKRTHHIHIIDKNNDILEQRLLFRYLLREHKNIKHDYEALKTTLSKTSKNDREAYTNEKLTFIKNTLRANGYTKEISR